MSVSHRALEQACTVRTLDCTDKVLLSYSSSNSQKQVVLVANSFTRLSDAALYASTGISVHLFGLHTAFRCAYCFSSYYSTHLCGFATRHGDVLHVELCSFQCAALQHFAMSNATSEVMLSYTLYCLYFDTLRCIATSDTLMCIHWTYRYAQCTSAHTACTG